jgi:peptidoglycan hydrolase-like amidase
MKKACGTGRLTGRLALGLSLILSNSTQIIVLADSNPARATGALAAQKQKASASNDRRSPRDQSDDPMFTRPRRAEAQSDLPQPSDGPIIRIGLMTDVASITVGSTSGFLVRRATTGLDGAKNISEGSLTIELRRLTEPLPSLKATPASYRVGVGSSPESRGARKLLDELRKKFFEPVTMSFDEKQSLYSVHIGQFANRSEAALFLERLRRAGYEDLRIISEVKSKDEHASESLADSDARTAKYKVQPSKSSTTRTSVKPEIQLIALAADRVAASSNDELVISPSERGRFDPGKQPVSSPGKDQPRGARRDQREFDESEARKAPTATAVRIGNKDYRGEIHLVLNPRGRINVVNALPLEDYLRGVVPLELSPGAYPEIEALKAQAIAARSYALARLGRHRDEGFDIVDDTRAQVYGGLSAERELTNRAIEVTRGLAAVFPNVDGKLVPIEALYTANCGGRTENNEEVFGGRPLPYLRGVACSPDRQSFAGRDIISRRTPELLLGIDGRSIAREVALLSVLGFSIPRRATGGYLTRSPEPDEMRSWIEQTARLTHRQKPSVARGDSVRLAEFARLVAASVYGEGRASTLLAPADVEYLLGGLRLQQVAPEARPDIAMLLKDGILRLPAAAELDGRTPITRGQAIETLARAIALIPQVQNLKSQPSDSKTQISNSRPQIPGLISDVAAPAENGRLILAVSGSSRESAAREREPRFTSVNTTGTGKLAGQQQGAPARSNSGNIGKGETLPPTDVAREGSERKFQSTSIEVSDQAALFRSLGGESHQVDRLTLIGGERVVYHLNDKGQIDFLEATISNRSASSDRFSSVAQWQERITVEDLQQRLARIRINVGQVDKVEPLTFSSSSRVTEVEVTGDEGRARLSRSQIRAALGLKEYLFVVDRETDARGQLVAFVFTGRGWGHGVGMCQTGAYGLAREGYSSTAILQRYYAGVKLQRLY